MAMPLGLIGLCSVLGLLAMYVGLQQPLVGAGIVYLSGFMALAWYKPEIALMFCFAAAPWQNDLTGTDSESHGKFSISELHIVLTFGVFLLKQLAARRWATLGPLTLPMVLHFAVCIFSSVQNMRPNTVISMIQMGLYMVMTFMLFASLPKPGESFRLCFAGVIVVASVLAAKSLTTGETYIWGLHKNGVGASMATALVIAIEFWNAKRGWKHRWILMAAVMLLAAGLLHSLSRGAWMSAIVALIVIAFVRRDFKPLIRMGMFIVPLVAICWMLLPDSSKEYATGLGKERANINARYVSMHYALDHFQRSPVYGVGVGLRKDYDATNIVFATLAETGVVGVCTFLSIHVVFVLTMMKTQRMLLPGSPIYMLPALGAGLLIGKLCNGMVDHYWSRGALTMAWAAAGMGLSAYWYVERWRRQQRQRGFEVVARNRLAALPRQAS